MQNRRVHILENGSWGAVAGRKIEEILSTLKGFEIAEEKISIKSALKAEQLEGLEKLAEDIASEVK